MQHKEGNFRGLKDVNIYYQVWQPNHTAKAKLVIAHGFAEHSGRYSNVVNYVVPKDFGVYALDHRGHGRSEGERVHVDDFSDYVSDLRTFFNIVRHESPEGKVFLIGHSMGSYIALLYATEYQHELTGLITSGSGLAQPGTPAMSLKAGDAVPLTRISRDPEVVRTFEKDPLVYHGLLPRSFGVGAIAISYLYDRVPKITLPTLIMAGTGVSDGERSHVLYDRIGSKDKTLKLYEGLSHEIFNEPEHLRVLADLESWIESHLRNGS